MGSVRRCSYTMIMDKAIKYTILATIAGVILAFNMYHADYKLLIAQVGTIILAAMILIKCSCSILCCRQAMGSVIIGSVRRCSYPMLIFLTVCVISFLISPHKITSGMELYKIATWIVFGMIAGSRLVPAFAGTHSNNILRASEASREANSIINIWLVCTAVVCMYGILQFFGADPMKLQLPHHRIVSTFGNATVFAGFLAMTLPVAVGRYIGSARRCSYGWLILLLIIFALLLTRSRAGIFTAAIGVFILFLQSRVAAASYAATTKAAQGAAATILGLILVLLIISYTRHIIFDTILRKTSRPEIWSGALQLIRTNPIMGTGIGTFSLYFPDFANSSIYNTHFRGVEFINHAHSEYLEILSEMGIIGLAAFLFVVYCSCAILWRQSREGSARRCSYMPGIFAAFIVILINNIVGVDLRYTSTGMFFWMMAGMFTQPNSVAAPSYGATTKAGQGGTKAAQGAATTIIIILAAITAIYFTIKPYALIKAPQEQDFFNKSISELDEKILKMNSVKADERDADYFFKLGILYAKKKDSVKATEFFYKTLEKKSNHAGAYNNLGNIEVEHGNIERARDYFKKTVEIEPENIEYLLNLASACFLLNKMEEATAAVEKVLKIDPNNSKALLLQRQMRQ